MVNPKISVITPVYNGAEFIRETIESVLNAITQIQFEYIVVNDGSTDSTLQILSEYSEQIKILSFENQGESASVNEGLFAAKGEYILVVSADDPILDGSLFEESARILDFNPKTVAVYPDWQVINETGEIKRKIIDHVSDINLPYTNRSSYNLIKEGIDRNKIYVTGNPIYEVIKKNWKNINLSKVLSELKLINKDFFLITLHRQENVDCEIKLRSILKDRLYIKKI